MPNMACGADMILNVGDLVEHTAYPHCRGIVKSLHRPRSTGKNPQYRKAVVLWFPLSTEAATSAPWSIQSELYGRAKAISTLKLRLLSSTKNKEVK